MKTKRGQSEIIVTVLLVLIAIAAVVFVGTFIINAVKSNAAKGEDKTKCLEVDMSIIKATYNAQGTDAALAITLEKGSNAIVDLSELRFYVAGKQIGSTSEASATDLQPNVQQTLYFAKDTAWTFQVGDTIDLAPVLASGTVCDKKVGVAIAAP